MVNKVLLSLLRNTSRTTGIIWDYSSTFTAPFNNMQTLKFKAQPTIAFFATVNQMFGGSSQLPTRLSELYSMI